MSYIYLYGMVMTTHAFLLHNDYPKPDGYAEIKDRFFHLGGETGTAAAVLSSLGCNIKLSGTHLGMDNKDLILDYFKDRSVDISLLKYNPDFEGVTDYVIIDKSSRTVFGRFGHYFTQEEKWFEKPNEEAIKNCCVVGTDPFFGDEMVDLCIKHDKPYAVIDSKHDTRFHQHCAVNAISHQYLKDYYADLSYDEAYQLFTEHTDGLVIFTMGDKPVMYGRKGQEPKFYPAFDINTVSTLGAGDSFKAGTIYGLYKGMNDDDLVAYATAVAGVACSNFPIPSHPPTQKSVKALLDTRK